MNTYKVTFTFEDGRELHVVARGMRKKGAFNKIHEAIGRDAQFAERFFGGREPILPASTVVERLDVPSLIDEMAKKGPFFMD